MFLSSLSLRRRKAPTASKAPGVWQLSLRLRDGPGCIHKADVTEGLREVAQQLVTRRIYLLSEQTDIIRIGNRLFEGLPGLLDLPGQCLRLGKPERAEQEGPFFASQPIGCTVAVDQSMLIGEPLSDSVDGGPHAWVSAGQEPHNRHHKIGGIQVIGAKRLGECSSFLAPPLSEDGVTDLLTCRCPGLNPVMRIQYIGKFDSAVKCDPTHELGVQEIPWVSTHLPDALVALAPACCRGVGYLDQEVARYLVESTELVVQAVCCIKEFPVDVELALIPGTVADAHRAAGTPSRQVIERAFREIAFAANSEHNLKINASPDLGSYCTSHPGEEPVCLIRTGCDPESFQRQAGITNPGVAVIPVALSPDGLGQRGGGCGDDGSRGAEHECLQHTATVMDQVPPRSFIPLMQV